MKGVVRPQARPTRMNPRVERMRDVGEGDGIHLQKIMREHKDL